MILLKHRYLTLIFFGGIFCTALAFRAVSHPNDYCWSIAFLQFSAYTKSRRRALCLVQMEQPGHHPHHSGGRKRHVHRDRHLCRFKYIISINHPEFCTTECTYGPCTCSTLSAGRRRPAADSYEQRHSGKPFVDDCEQYTRYIPFRKPGCGGHQYDRFAGNSRSAHDIHHYFSHECGRL